MSITDVLFYLFAILTVGSALLVVATRNIVYAAFALMLSLFGVAALYVMLHADFLAATQVLVYVGGILVLVVFGVMMTSGKLDMKLKMDRGHVFPGAIVCLALFGLLLGIVFQIPWQIQISHPDGKAVKSIGEMILGKYLLPIEVASRLLLVALVGAVLLTRKEIKETDE